jgi:hypothetical protein
LSTVLDLLKECPSGRAPTCMVLVAAPQPRDQLRMARAPLRLRSDGWSARRNPGILRQRSVVGGSMGDEAIFLEGVETLKVAWSFYFTGARRRAAVRSQGRQPAAVAGRMNDLD